MKKSIVIGWLMLIVILALVLTVFLTLKFSKIPDKNCNVDSDCVKMQTTCCSCNMGGEEKCAGKIDIEKYKEELKTCGKNLMCIAVYNCKVNSCACVNNTCITK